MKSVFFCILVLTCVGFGTADIGSILGSLPKDGKQSTEILMKSLQALSELDTSAENSQGAGGKPDLGKLLAGLSHLLKAQPNPNVAQKKPVAAQQKDSIGNRSGEEESDLVPIIVGSSLAGLVLVVLIGYLIIRFKN